MKHLKKFNEELNPETYRKIGNKLISKNHVNRGIEFIKHGDDLDFRKAEKEWGLIVTKYSKYNKVKIKNFKGDFYPIYEIYERDYYKGNEFFGFGIVEGFIPCDIETLKEVYISGLNEIIIYNRIFIFSIEHHDGYSKLSDVTEYGPTDVISRDRYYDHYLCDERSARYCYTLFKSFFKENSDYPYSPYPFIENSYVETIYDYINDVVIAPYSDKTGITGPEDFLDKFIKSYPNKYDFFKE